MEGSNSRGDDVKQENAIKEETSSEGSASIKEENSSTQIKSKSDTCANRCNQNCLQRSIVVSAESDENEEDCKDSKDGIKQEKQGSTTPNDKKDGQANANATKTEKEAKDAQRAKDIKIAESEMVRDMKAQLK